MTTQLLVGEPIRPEFQTRPKSFWRSILDYALLRCTPAFILSRDSLSRLAPMLRGRVIELGGYRKLHYSVFATQANGYTVTNISGDYDEFVDILNMGYPDNSVDSFMCVTVLEHMSDPWQALREIHRCLKPSGRLLLVVPFMYQEHGVPNDFYRFTRSALLNMLHGFNMLRLEHLGGRLSTISLLLQRKWTLPLGCLFFILSCFCENSPNDCPMLYVIVAEKVDRSQPMVD